MVTPERERVPLPERESLPRSRSPLRAKPSDEIPMDPWLYPAEQQFREPREQPSASSQGPILPLLLDDDDLDQLPACPAALPHQSTENSPQKRTRSLARQQLGTPPEKVNPEKKVRFGEDQKAQGKQSASSSSGPILPTIDLSLIHI